MVHLCFIPKENDEEKAQITFGTQDKIVTIDVSFIPSGIGFNIKQIMSEVKGEIYPPDVLARIICLFTDEVSPDWVVNNCEYGVLDQIVGIIIQKSFLRRAEKN